ncbi:hypothetical protein GCM10009037_29340 [Halarchaeum grantii]|uniref:DUF7827 domain-containing protein n=1 Tax=Halarchaeum grantii TaxID=1193105 RepID=A0A830EZ13_9EURY|nr:hypothetical protein [Halarchaeum grantii]GGL44038.1 hypothetical protein GCM10009037_29340 [Halarchaeum grantii]
MDRWGQSGQRTLFVVLCLIAASASGGVATAQHAAVSFSNPTTVEQQGDIATIPLEFSDTEQVSLQISSADGNYSTTLQVRDGNGDGQVTVELDTSKVGQPKAAYNTRGSEDSITFTSQNSDVKADLLPTGRYNLIITSGSARIASVMMITEPTVYGSTSYTISGETPASVVAEYRFAENTSQNTTEPLDVATGDLMVANFHLSGIESALQSTNPGEKAVFMSDSTPGAHTEHTLQLSAPNQTVRGQSLTLDYEQTPTFHSRQLVRSIGIDTNSDGIIDRSLKPQVSSYKTTSSGELSIEFSNPVVINASETLLFQYSVENSNESEDTIQISLGDYQMSETIKYGLTGQGTLGAGVDLQIHSNNTQILSPLMAINETYSSEANTLSTVTNTDQLPEGAYNISLEVDSRTYPTGEHIRFNKTFTVSQPAIHNLSISNSNNSISVSAQTNYAAGTPLVVEASSSTEDFQFLSRYTSTVSRTGEIATEVSIPSQASEPVNVTIMYEGDVVAGPVEYPLPENETTTGSTTSLNP